MSSIPRTATTSLRLVGQMNWRNVPIDSTEATTPGKRSLPPKLAWKNRISKMIAVSEVSTIPVGIGPKRTILPISVPVKVDAQCHLEGSKDWMTAMAKTMTRSIQRWKWGSRRYCHEKVVANTNSSQGDWAAWVNDQRLLFSLMVVASSFPILLGCSGV